MSERIVDCKGNTVVVGTPVIWGDYPEARPAFVVGITEMDGDVDDDGRGVMIPPRVTVRFEDGTEDGTSTYDVTPHSWALSYPDGPDEWLFQCDEIEVVA